MLHAVARRCEGDSCDWNAPGEVAEVAKAQCLALATLQPGACGCAAKAHAGVQHDLCVLGSPRVNSGVVSMLVHDWCWLLCGEPDGLESLPLRKKPGMCGTSAALGLSAAAEVVVFLHGVGLRLTEYL